MNHNGDIIEKQKMQYVTCLNMKFRSKYKIKSYDKTCHFFFSPPSSFLKHFSQTSSYFRKNGLYFIEFMNTEHFIELKKEKYYRLAIETTKWFRFHMENSDLLSIITKNVNETMWTWSCKILIVL